MNVNILSTAVVTSFCASNSKAFMPSVSKKLDYPTPSLRNAITHQEKVLNFPAMGKDLTWDCKEKMWVPAFKDFQPLTNELPDKVKDLKLMAIAS